jgi:3-isopropylmalate/(R)-2-methylmalate dehydratase small subunit
MQTTHTVHVYGDNINTDLIFAGKYTYTLRDPQEIASHALEDLDAAFTSRVKPGDIIVAGKNWGCGSSREQAVTCLKWNGIGMIAAASFGGLYLRNCINQGVRPVLCPDLRHVVQTGDTVIIDSDAHTISANGHIFTLPRLSPGVQAILDAGGLVPMLSQRFRKEA